MQTLSLKTSKYNYHKTIRYERENCKEIRAIPVRHAKPLA